MKYLSGRRIIIVSLLAASLFILLGLVLSTTFKSTAQEPVSQEKRKSLREIAQDRDVELVAERHSEIEYSLETLVNSEAIIQGKIIGIETTLETDSLYTTYTIETQRAIKPFVSGLPLEAYQILNKPAPAPIKSTFKISRVGGALLVDGHRISERVAGLDELKRGDSYIFFISWSGDYQTYMLAGGISGVLRVNRDGTLVSLATDKDVREVNDSILEKNRSVENFVELQKKKKKLELKP